MQVTVIKFDFWPPSTLKLQVLYWRVKCLITSTFLVSPASDKAGCPCRHHSPGPGQTDGADLLCHIDRLGQMHQGYVIGDVSAILLVDKPLVANDAVHLVAGLR